MKPQIKPRFEKETFTDVKDDYKVYIVSKCKECGKLFWTRKDRVAVYCSASCQQFKIRKNNGKCPQCGKQIPRCCPTGIQFVKRKFCSRKCAWKANRLDNHNSWKGGRNISSNGYVLIKDGVGRNSYEPEHRRVMEQHIGRKLSNKEVVHHINNDRKDNRVENLILFKSNAEHSQHHWDLRKGKTK